MTPTNWEIESKLKIKVWDFEAKETKPVIPLLGIIPRFAVELFADQEIKANIEPDISVGVAGPPVVEVAPFLLVATQYIAPKIVDFFGNWVSSHAGHPLVVDMETADGRKIHLEASASTTPEKLQETLRVAREQLRRL